MFAGISSDLSGGVKDFQRIWGLRSNGHVQKFTLRGV